MLQSSRFRFLKRLLPGLISLVCVVVFAACTDNAVSDNSQSSGSSPNGSAPLVLKVATAPNFPPFEFKQADGALVGFDIDLINAIGEAGGFLIDFDEFPTFDDTIRELYAHEVDAAISAISITADRAEQVSFSRPYFKSGLSIAVAESEQNIQSIDNLSGALVGAQPGTTGEAKAESIAGAEVRLFNTVQQALQDLAQGKINAAINDTPVTAYAIKSGSVSGIKLVGAPLTEEYYGIASPKDSPYLENINQGLTQALQNGTYTQIYKKWFDGEPPQLPETLPT